MLYTNVIFGLVATATAVDIRLYDDFNCKGTYVACVGRNPHECCASGRSQAAVGLFAIPSNWAVWFTGHHDLCSNSYIRGEWSNGRSTICFGRSVTFNYLGAMYRFDSGEGNIKRSIGDKVATECATPTELGFEDGTKFNITGLDGDTIERMSLAQSPADVPEQLQYLKLDG